MGINRNRSFFKMKVDILRPSFGNDGDTTGVGATGYINAIAGNLITDGESFKVQGCSDTYTFEFDKDGNLVVPNSLSVPITNLMTGPQVRDAIVTAINATTSTSGLSGSAGGGSRVNITNTVVGTCGNWDIIDDVANINFNHVGMSGGLDPVSSIRNPLINEYLVDVTNIRTFIEPIHSDIVMQGQVGGIEVARSVGFFPKDTDIRVNDIVRENANVYNGNVTKYWKVIGRLDYSRYDFHIRVDLDVMNYQRE